MDSELVELFKKHNHRLDQTVLNAAFKERLGDVTEVINRYLAGGKVQVIQNGYETVYVYTETDENFENLSQVEKKAYQLIMNSGSQGIQLIQIKKIMQMQPNVIKTAVEKLVELSLVKALPMLRNKNKKLYFGISANPVAEVSSGPWYSDDKIDDVFVKQLGLLIVRYVNSKTKQLNYDTWPTLDDIHAFIKQSNVVKVPLTIEDVNTIVSIAVANGELQYIETCMITRYYTVVMPKVFISTLPACTCEDYCEEACCSVSLSKIISGEHKEDV